MLYAGIITLTFTNILNHYSEWYPGAPVVPLHCYLSDPAQEVRQLNKTQLLLIYSVNCNIIESLQIYNSLFKADIL